MRKVLFAFVVCLFFGSGCSQPAQTQNQWQGKGLSGISAEGGWNMEYRATAANDQGSFFIKVSWGEWGLSPKPKVAVNVYRIGVKEPEALEFSNHFWGFNESNGGTNDNHGDCALFKVFQTARKLSGLPNEASKHLDAIKCDGKPYKS